MNKILSKIAIAIASFAMAIGGISTVSLHNKEQAKPVYAENGDVVAAFNSDNDVGYTYSEYERNGWKLSWGGSYKCGFAAGQWKTIEEQGYSKYINGTDASPDAYGWVLARTETLSFVGSFDFQAYFPPSSYVYLTYSFDDITYSLVPLTEGEQGTTLNANIQSLSYGFNSIREAYYAVVVVSTKTNPDSNDLFEFTDTLCNFYEKIDPNEERITISGTNVVYADEDIELTLTAYNFSPTEYVVTSSDTSIATVSRNGNTVVVHGVSRGATNITISTSGTNGIVYTDPFTITVKKFDFRNLITSIVLNTHETKRIDPYYEDKIGTAIVTEVSSDNSNIAEVKIYNQRPVITAGSIGGISTTITLIAKDNGGADGCHVTTATIQVTVSAWRFAGERLTSKPYENTYAYIATIDGGLFLKAPDISISFGVTNDIKEATLFYLRTNGKFSFTDSNGEALSIRPLSSTFNIVGEGNGYGFNISNGNDKYPGLLVANNYFMFYDSDNDGIRALAASSIVNYENSYGVSPSNVFCAYYAVDPGPNITPEETNIELFDGDSTDIDAEVAFVTSIDYEILNGAPCVEEVTVSEVDNQNHINIHVEASSHVTGTAVIRVKDANDDSVYTDITVVVKSATKARVNSTPTQAKLSYSYVVQDKMSYDISDVAIRFGGMLEKDIWNDLDSNYGIEAFGVMLSNSNLIEQCVNEKIADEGSFETAVETGGKYDTVKDNDIKVFYDYLSSGRKPAEQGNYYFWNLYKMVNATEVGFTRQYTAVAFILTSDGNVVFFDEVTTSAARLARELNTANPNLDTTLEGSLSYIANFDQEN